MIGGLLQQDGLGSALSGQSRCGYMNPLIQYRGPHYNLLHEFSRAYPLPQVKDKTFKEELQQEIDEWLKL